MTKSACRWPAGGNLTLPFPCPWASQYLLTLTVLSCIQIATISVSTKQFLYTAWILLWEPLIFREKHHAVWDQVCVHCSAWYCIIMHHCMTLHAAARCPGVWCPPGSGCPLWRRSSSSPPRAPCSTTTTPGPTSRWTSGCTNPTRNIPHQKKY